MLKKVFLVGLLLVTFSLDLLAQFSWGVRTGFQTNTLRFNNEPGLYNWKTGYLIPGLYFQQDFLDNTALSLDLQFANKGFVSRYSEFTGLAFKFVELKQSLGYIALPLLFHYKPTTDFSAFLGPEFGILVSSSYIENGERVSDDGLFTNPFDFGISGGVSYQISEGYRLMLRYTHGLSNVLEKDVVRFNVNGQSIVNAETAGYKFTNRALQLTLSSEFNISEQEQSTRVSYGIRQGISSYYIFDRGQSAIGAKNIDKRIGFETGLELRFIFRKYFFLSTGINYLQKGGQLQGDDPVKLNYLSLPLIIGVSPIKTDMLTVSIETGLGFDRQIKAVNPYENSTTNEFHTAYKNVGSLMYGFEVSTDAINKLTMFLSYRKWEDARFYDQNYSRELVTNGQSLSIGVRIRPDKRNRPEPTEAEIADYDNVSAVGLKAGVNFSSVLYKMQPSDLNKSGEGVLGGHFGVYFKIRLGKRFALTPELNYIRKQPNHIAFENPFMLSYAFKNRMAIEAGPQWNIDLTNDSRVVGDYVEGIATPMDLGVNAGVRYRVSQKMALGLRFYHGLNDIYSLHENGTRLPAIGYNRNLQLTTYYKLSRKY